MTWAQSTSEDMRNLILDSEAADDMSRSLGACLGRDTEEDKPARGDNADRPGSFFGRAVDGFQRLGRDIWASLLSHTYEL